MNMRPKPGKSLGVDTRVKAAIRAHKAEHELATMSVSAICRAAGVSRANLYEHHPELVKEILAWGAKNITANGKSISQCEQLKAALRDKKELQIRFNAILAICVELQAEVRVLRANASRTNRRNQKSSKKLDI